MSKRTIVRLVVGVERDDIDAERELSPLVVGCVPESVWEVDPDSSDNHIAEFKERYTMDASYYEWREVWALLDTDALADLFRTPEVTAELGQGDA